MTCERADVIPKMTTNECATALVDAAGALLATITYERMVNKTLVWSDVPEDLFRALSEFSQTTIKVIEIDALDDSALAVPMLEVLATHCVDVGKETLALVAAEHFFATHTMTLELHRAILKMLAAAADFESSVLSLKRDYV